MKSQHQDPIYSQISQVKDAVSEVLEHAKKLGATAAEAAMSSTSGLSVSTRMGEVRADSPPAGIRADQAGRRRAG